jgi:transposase
VILGVPSRPGLRIVVASTPTDFRKGMDSLVALVTQALESDPFTGDVFIFRSRRSDRLKILLWDGSGLCLITKRLESGAFTWPPVRDGAMTLNAAQLRLLFTGMDWTQLGGAGHDSAGASPWNASGEMREIATPTG